jgi:ADP-ribosylation factor related protein 1
MRKSCASKTQHLLPIFAQFSLMAGFWQMLFTRPSLHVLLIGLDHAGKTTFLEKIKSKFGNSPGLPPDKIPPTVGMNLAKISHKGYTVVIWDLGGQQKMRSIWDRYYDEADCVVFIVDSADMGRFEEAKLAYDSVRDNDILSRVPLLTIANKQDLPGALTPGDLAMNFYPVQDAAERARVFPVSALNGQGVEDVVLSMIDEAQKHAARTPRRQR